MNPASTLRQKDLGALLLEQGKITEQQLDAVRRRQSRLGLPQHRALVDLNFASEEDTWRALAKANNQLKETSYQLAQYNAAVEQAKESLLILENRYKQGLVSTTDMLQAQTQLSQQTLYYQQAVMMHNSTLAYIRFLTAH